MREKLDDYINRYINNDEYDEMVGYIGSMPDNDKGKNELIECIFQFDIKVLYHMFFEKYNLYITLEEYMRCTERYAKLFNDPLPPVCKQIECRLKIEKKES